MDTPKEKGYLDLIKMVKVTWVDSKHVFGWHHQDDVKDLAAIVCESVGFLLEDNLEELKLAQSLSGESVGNLLAIPKIVVKEIKELG